MLPKILIMLVLSLLVFPGYANDRRDTKSSHPWEQASRDGLLVTKKWDELSREEKKRVQEARDRYKELPRDKKERLRKQWEDMPKKEKEKYKLERKYR